MGTAAHSTQANYNCQHIDEHTQGTFRCVSIGDTRVLWLCAQCWMALVGRVTYHLVYDAIKDGVRSAHFGEHKTML